MVHVFTFYSQITKKTIIKLLKMLLKVLTIGLKEAEEQTEHGTSFSLSYFLLIQMLKIAQLMLCM